jgi:hypothetical protein
MSVLKISLLAASFLAIVATSADAQRYYRSMYQPTNEWPSTGYQPFSRDAAENFTW